MPTNGQTLAQLRARLEIRLSEGGHSRVGLVDVAWRAGIIYRWERDMLLDYNDERWLDHGYSHDEAAQLLHTPIQAGGYYLHFDEEV